MDNARSCIQFLKSAENKYDVLYINTPWSKLETEAIGKFPVNDITEKNAAVFLWVDSNAVTSAAKLVEKWGLTFHSVLQIADFAKYPWMTKDNELVGEDTEKKPRRKNRVPPIVSPSWWSSPLEQNLSCRPTTEQLWLLVKGDAGDIFASTTNTVPSQVVNLPDVGKKSRAKKKEGFGEEWDTDRPLCFLETVLSMLEKSKRVLNVFASNLDKINVDKWGPGIPGGYLNVESDGLMASLNTTMMAMKKSQLQVLHSKLSKYNGSSLEEKKTILNDMKESWTAVEKTLSSSYKLTYDWKDDTGILSEWAAHLVFTLAGKNIVNFSSLRVKRKKKRKTSSNSPAPKHGIAAAGRITPELADFFGMEHGEKIARTAAVSKLNEYIVENNLQNPENRLQILMDEPLKKLLRPPPDFGPVTYFNLCKIIGIHFPPKTEQEKKEDSANRIKNKKAKVEAVESKAESVVEHVESKAEPMELEPKAEPVAVPKPPKVVQARNQVKAKAVHPRVPPAKSVQHRVPPAKGVQPKK